MGAENRAIRRPAAGKVLAMEEIAPQAAAVASSAKAGRDLYCVFYLALAAIGASFALVGYALFFR